MKEVWERIHCKTCNRVLGLVKKAVRHVEGEIWCPYCETKGNPSGVTAFKKDYAHEIPVAKRELLIE